MGGSNMAGKGWAAMLLAVCSVVTVVHSGPAAAAPPKAAVHVPAVVHPDAATTSIDDAGGAPSATKPAGKLSPELERATGTQTVEVVGSSGAAAAVKAAGGTVVRAANGLVLAKLTTAQLRAVAASSAVQAVRPPVDLKHAALSTSYLGPTNSDTSNGSVSQWDEWGSRANGVKVGIIDYFDPTTLANQISTGELNNITPDREKCYYLGSECPFGTPGADHGNAVAEVLQDHARGATLYLAEVGSITDYLAAIDWFASKGVTIVSHSLLGPFDAPGDGTGASDYVVDYAVSKGMAWFNAAGNGASDPQYYSYKGGYWRQQWYDPDKDNWLNFFGTDESLTSFCGALLGVRWSDWGANKTDYALYISDYRYATKTQGPKVLASDWNQATGGAPPLEGNDLRWLCNHDPAQGPVYDTNGDGFVSLWIFKNKNSLGTPNGDVIEVMVNQGFLEYSTTAGSANVPFADSKNPGMSSVGAVDAQGNLYGYSAQGPLNDGTIKPDIVARSCMVVSEITDDCFAGTSSSAPVAAGYAAMIQGRLGPTAPWQLQKYLQGLPSVSALPAQTNQKGWGQPLLPSYALWVPPPGSGLMYFRPQASPTRVLETRPAPIGPIGISTPMRLKANSSLSFDTSTVTHLLPGPEAVFNITAVNPNGTGYLQLSGAGASYPGAFSTLNVAVTGQVVPNLAVVRTGWNNKYTIYSTVDTDVIVDLLGYFWPEKDPNDNGSGRYHPTPPARVFDSRTCLGGAGGCVPGALAAGSATTLTVTGGATGIDPADASSVIVEITADTPLARGYLSAVPYGTAPPYNKTSNLNVEQGITRTATAIVPLSNGSNGRITIFTQQATNLQVDVVGYFNSNLHRGDVKGMFLPIAQARSHNTTDDPARPAAGSVYTFPIVTLPQVPDLPIIGVLGNLTTAHATTGGELRAGRPDDLLATTTELSFPNRAGATANALIAPTANGELSTWSSGVSDRIVDVAGVFMDGDPPLQPGQITAMLDANGHPPQPNNVKLAISADGKSVAWRSPLDGTVVWNSTTNVVTPMSVQHGGLPFALNSNGTKIALLGSASEFNIPGDPATNVGLYVQDVATGAITPVLADNGGGPIGLNLDGVVLQANHDLTRFVFTTNNGQTIYFRDVTKNTLTDITGLAQYAYQLHLSGSGNVLVNKVSLSPDVRVINLDDFTTKILSGPINSVQTVMSVDDNGTTVLVDRYFPGAPDGGWYFTIDVATGTTTNVETDDKGNPRAGQRQGGGEDDAVLSGDGHSVLMGTFGLLTTDLNSGGDLYLRDLVTGQLELVTRNASGTDIPNPGGYQIMLSDDGNTVLFTSDSTQFIPGVVMASGYDRALYLYHSMPAP